VKSGYPTRILAIVLALLTLGAVTLAVANFVQELGYDAPTDGARLSETARGMRVDSVPADSPAARAGIRAGDVLIAINETPTPRLAAAQRLITASGVWSHATYSLERPGPGGHTSHFDVQVILEPADRSDFQIMRLIALIYLAIGLYVLFRRWTAPKSVHFYVFCLVSFGLYAFKYTGVLDGLDTFVYWCNVVASALQPALFLHFAGSFAEAGNPQARRKQQALYALLYVPGAVLISLRYLSIAQWSSTGTVQHRLNQLDYAYLALFYAIAAFVFWRSYRAETRTLERQQLKWLTRGTLLTVVPFTALYVVPYLLDATLPGVLTKFAGLSLILLPLTFSWAIVRYRLMDVDLIFKRGVTYTLFTAALVGLYFAVVALSAVIVHVQLPSLRVFGLVAAVIATGLLLDPLKGAIQARVDRVFDTRRLDYRETLVDFGRSLSSQTDLPALLASIVERLSQTLLITRVAVFISNSETAGRAGEFTLGAAHGLGALSTNTALDLSFLTFDNDGAKDHLFFENPQSVLRLPPLQQQTASSLDLNYYLPCRASRHDAEGLQTIAVIGLGRTSDGDFLSSEDVSLLESLASYIGIAIQNAQLYRTLQQKITDFERLKDFNENIVESINVGVFAVDLDDCIESWNAQMEVMYAVPRADALRRSLRDVFAPDFADAFYRARTEQGIDTLYKLRFVTPAGETRTANVTIAPLLNRDMHPIGRIVIVNDLTGRIQLEEQVAQAEKLSSIGLLAAGVAHEVNTPLAVISSYTQMLAKQMKSTPDTERLTPVLEKITQQTFRASEIVNGLLNFSRTGGSESRRTDLNALLRETAQLLEHQMRSGNVDVQMHFDPQLPAIQGNPGKLQQVAVNLLMNARDALQDIPDARIDVTTYAEDDAVFVRIADNGLGMSAETIRRMYDPFFTTKGSPKPGQRRGTGLGLAVTYGIVQEHGGKISVASTPGEGATFVLEFRAMAAAHEAQSEKVLHG
jgi:PAS domain S-box-containing protein